MIWIDRKDCDGCQHEHHFGEQDHARVCRSKGGAIR